MSETLTKRRRGKYSKLICLGCRARRIRCVLPDTEIHPSSEPQPPENACQRCQQNGLDCIVDYTTLGRPAEKRKRKRIEQASSANVQQTIAQSDDDFEEPSMENVEDYLLTQQNTNTNSAAGIEIQQQKITKSEMHEALLNPFQLLSALLSKDKYFASSIGSQPLITASVLEIVNENISDLLDAHLVWHRTYYPDIPSMPQLREQLRSMERGRPERPALLFMLTLLYDLALDVPSSQLASCRTLQPAIRALVFHTGQHLLFSLPINKVTVLNLVLAAQYRPLAFTSSQVAASNALKAVPYILLAKQTATELGCSNAGIRLSETLETFDILETELLSLIYECLHWIRLSIATINPESVFKLQAMDQTTFQCVDALRTTLLGGRMPVNALLPYCIASCSVNMLVNFKKLSENWRDLDRLAEIITSHREHCVQERKALERALGLSGCSTEHVNAISHLAEGEHHRAHTSVVGFAMFFAVMCGAYAASSLKTVQSMQAMEISERIIDQLLAENEEDPDRSSHRKFLEVHGHDRMDMLQRTLTNFITATDTLSLEGIPYVGPPRQIVSFLLSTCKDIVEGNAARLKGWGGLDDHVDVQMILLHECARRLEAMSYTAGTEEAMGKGDILTATAKLIRSLHRILQGFKRSVVTSQRRNTSEGTKLDPTPGSGSSNVDASAVGNTTSSSSGLDSTDLFSEWDNWPQFDAFDFTDLFGNVFNWDPSDTF